ncbi:MAG: hypothetical protein KME55_32850 [Nostoc indistinguendum CM1-VF10]|jgi:hypothetical protein|nr:hypothetical protein [Nostoc indistinguendum CM1-VF10]
MTPTDYIRAYQIRNNLDPKQLSEELLISMSHYYKFFTQSQHKRSPSPHVCRIAQLTEFIKQNGLEPPPPVFES